MSTKSQKKVIGDTEYEVFQLGFSASRKTGVHLAKLLGPVAKTLLTDIMKEAKKEPDRDKALKKVQDDLGSMDVQVVADVVMEFLSTVEDDDLVRLTEAFAGERGAKTLFRVSGSDQVLQLDAAQREMQFAGGEGLLEFFQWLFFAMQVNYGGFFSFLSRLAVNAPG